MKKITEGEILVFLYTMSLRDSEQLKSMLALCTQDTVHKCEEPNFSRLKDMERRFLDQKIEDRNIDARRDDKTAQGAAQRRGRERKTKRLLSVALEGRTMFEC